MKKSLIIMMIVMIVSFVAIVNAEESAADLAKKSLTYDGKGTVKEAASLAKENVNNDNAQKSPMGLLIAVIGVGAAITVNRLRKH